MPGGITTSGGIGKLLQDGVNSTIENENSNYAPEYDKILKVQTSKKAFEQDVPFAGVGTAKVKDAGSSLEYDDMKTAAAKTYTHVNYALGGIITEEAMEDDLYQNLGDKLGRSLSKALNTTKEITAANVFNNGYATTTTWDGKFLFSASHSLVKGGTFSNMLAVAAPLSEASLEDACIAIARLKDDSDRVMKVIPQSLHIPPDLMFIAERILGSTLQNDTANNAINALRSTGKFPGGVHVNHYFTDTANWFIQTDADDGGKLFLRNPAPKTGTDNDFGTSNYYHKIQQRWSQGVSNARAYYGSGAN